MKSLTYSSYYLMSLLLVSAFNLAGCDNNNPAIEPAKDLRERTNLTIPTYTVAMDADYPPYDFRDDQGNPVGFDVDVIQAIGEKQGFKVEIIPVKWSALLDSLGRNTYDLAMGGIAMSDLEDKKYKNLYLPSNYYFYGNDAIATPVGVNNIKTFKDLKHHKVATLSESAYINDLTELQGEKTKNFIAEETTFLAYKDLFNGRAEAVLADKGVLSYYQLTKPQYRIVISGEGDYFSEPYGMVFIAQHRHQALIRQINQGIADIVSDGTYTQIHQKWFGTEPKILPTTHLGSAASAPHPQVMTK